MNKTEGKIKQKMLEVLERVVDDPLLIPEEWKTLFGETSVMRAAAIVSRMKDGPADEKETIDDTQLTPEEEALWLAWKLEGKCCKGCSAPLAESLRD